MSDPAAAPANAWNRGFTSFAGAAQNGNGAPAAAPATSWRGAAAATAPTAAGSRWAAQPAPAAKADLYADDAPAESSESRSWFEGGHHRKDSASSQSLAAGSSGGANSSAWRSNRVDKLKTDSNTNSGNSTPQLQAQPAPTTAAPTQSQPLQKAANEIVYQPSDFGPAEHPNIRWYYLDPQRETQGPFTSEDMSLWYVASYFDLKLPVQCLPEGAHPRDVASTKFIPLGVWFLHGNRAFLTSLPDIVEQGRKGAHTTAPAATKDASDTITSSSDAENLAKAGASGVSAAVLASDRNALSPVDESSSYAASVHQLIADDDDLSNLQDDVTELERYNSNSQPSQQNAQQPQGVGLNPTAQPWNQRNAAFGAAPSANQQQQWQNQQQQQQGGGVQARGPSSSSTSPSWPAQAAPSVSRSGAVSTGQLGGGAPSSNSAQLLQQRVALQQLRLQFNQFAPLNLNQLLQSVNLTAQQASQLTQQQIQQLEAQFTVTNQQRLYQQQHISRQIQQLLLAQQQLQAQSQPQQPQQQPQQAQGQGSALSFQQQQQHYLMQQQKLQLQQQQGGQLPYQQQQQSQSQPQSQQRVSQQQFGAADAFGRQPTQQQQQYGLNAPSSSPFGQQQQPQSAYGANQQQQLYGGIQQQPQSQQQRAAYGDLKQQQAWNGQPTPQSNAFGFASEPQLRDQFGNLTLTQPTQQLMYDTQQLQLQQLHAYSQQQQAQQLQQSQPQQQQQATDLQQTIVYTPNQVQTGNSADYQAQQQQPQQAYQQEPTATFAQEEPHAEEQPTEEAYTEEQESGEQEPEASTEELAAEPEVAESESVDESAAVESADETAVSAAPSVAPWVAKTSGDTPVKVKSLVEIQAEEERAQKALKERTAAASAASNIVRRSTQPFNTTWGGQSVGLSLTPDETSTAQVIHANTGSSNALLPTPPSTTPSIKLLTPILATVKQPRQPLGKIGKNGRRTEAAIVQMDQPIDAATAAAVASATASPAAAASPNAWGTKPAASVSSPVKAADAAPAPVVNAWAAKRTTVVSPPLATPLLPHPSPSSSSAVPTLASLNPPLLTIRPKSMQNLDGSAAPTTVTKPLNTVRILETHILEMPTPQQRKSGAGRTGSSSTRTSSTAISSAAPRKATTSSTSGASSAVDETPSVFGGPTMSAEFERWCLEHLTAIAGADGYDVSLPQFLMTVSSDEEAKAYLREYLGTGPQIDEFANEFLQLKAFGMEGPKAEEESGKRRRKGKNMEF